MKLADCKYYGLVPKDPIENLLFRKELITWGYRDVEAALELWIMCARDPLFYINAFCFTYDPRTKEKTPPFVTYEFQDNALLDILTAIEEGKDILQEKSRDMGASWLNIMAHQWLWQFHPHNAFIWMSRTEALVDSSTETGDPKSLFAKFDFVMKYQPQWLKPSFNRTKLRVLNEDNGSTVAGETTTSESGRGGRCTAMLCDEFAFIPNSFAVAKATRDVTTARAFNSTPNGTGNAFYQIRNSGNIKVLRFHWTDHPVKSAGLYSSGKKGIDFKILDTDYEFPDDYPFIKDGKIRSVWYDNECKRIAHAQEIAQELDIDYLGSAFQFFDATTIDAYRAEHCLAPFAVVEPDIDYTECRVLDAKPHANGRLNLWRYPGHDDQWMDGDQYVIGADISQGTRASDSVLSITDKRTGEKVGEYTCNFMRPDEFGQLAVALCRWFNDAYLVWEANGPGRGFGDAVIKAGYRNIYYRMKDDKITKDQTDIPGWYSTTQNKISLLSSYRSALNNRHFINRSKTAIDQTLEYAYTNKGIFHNRQFSETDPSDNGENHGDHVIADAVCWMGVERQKQDIREIPNEYPEGSHGYRWKKRQDRAKEKALW